MAISIQTTSNNSSIGEDIILRQTTTTRLLFRPELINNQHNTKAAVKGCFIYQKKKGKDTWEDYKDLSLKNLRAEEWIKLAIKSEELLVLLTELKKYYTIHEEYGVKNGSYVLITSELEILLRKFESNNLLLMQLLDDEKGKIFEQTLEWVVNTENSEKIVGRFLQLNETDLDQLNSLIGIANLRRILNVWEANMGNKTEQFWQELLKNNTWVLSQIFSNPTVLIGDEVYIGGKTTSNNHGKLVDFFYANPLSKDAVLIEIKTPSTPLLNRTEYRAGVYSAHNDLAGAVSQVLTYKGSLKSEYSQLLVNNIKAGKIMDFDVIEPNCVVIAGRLDSLKKPELIHSFEIYRKELRNVIVITFDELFMKIQTFIDMLS